MDDIVNLLTLCQLIAGRFGHVGLCQLRTKTVLYAVDKGLRGRNVLQSVVIDSATYLLTISSPDIDNVAMSLYDIIYNMLIPC